MSNVATGKNAVPTATMQLEQSAIGRIVVPPSVPPGFKVFYTTIDFDGRIDDRIHEFVRPAELFSCHQVHGVGVRAGFSRPDRLKKVPTPEPECDALWSDQKQSALAIKVADCLAVSIIDATNSVIANIHSGWRGAVQRITEVALDAAPLDRRQSFAFLGPSIRVCCFEVGEEVAAQFDDRFVDRTRGAKPHLDIPWLTTAILLRRGFAQERIIDTELCTRCDGGVAGLATRLPLFHSYRRDRKSGRTLAIVAQ